MDRRDLDSVRESVKRWARGRPHKSPAVARARVLARLEERRSWSRLWLAASATAIVGLAVALLLVVPTWPPGSAIETVEAVPVIDRHQPLVVYELSSGTTVYLTLDQTAVIAGEPGDGRGDEL